VSGSERDRVRRIAVTGGPGAGKTTVLREVARAHPEVIVAVPEVATLLLSHVFPQVRDADERRALQRAIYEVQRNLESLHGTRLREGQVLLCDRGTPDGGGYWPEGHEAFFAAMQTRWEDELARYDAVVFLETAAAGGLSIMGGDNETRTEDLDAALRIDRRLHDVWSRHPRFVHIGHELDFAVKMERGREALRAWLAGS
jgi:predicted ATPase